jgi:hypothetical protein
MARRAFPVEDPDDFPIVPNGTGYWIIGPAGENNQADEYGQ